MVMVVTSVVAGAVVAPGASVVVVDPCRRIAPVVERPELQNGRAHTKALEIDFQATPWDDVRPGREPARTSLRFVDAIHVAAAERHGTGLLTSDARIGRSGAPLSCPIITVSPARSTTES